MTSPMNKYGIFLVGVLLSGASLYFFTSTSYYKSSFLEYHFRSKVEEVKVDIINLNTTTTTTTTTTTPAAPPTTVLTKVAAPPTTVSAKVAEPDTTFLKYILNLPEWYRKGDWGLRKNVSLETTANLKNKFSGSDNEEIIAWNNFFYGTTNGVVLELGAMEGKSYSISRFFETEAGWKTILIEGNPIQAVAIPKNRPNAINFNAVICEKPRTVHFAQHRDTGGIVEFMEKGFLQRFHTNLLTNGTLDTNKVGTAGNVIKIPCVPISHLLLPLKFFHVNFFMLDVEGGELNVLKAIDFEKIKFDVIAVETDRGTDSKEDTKNYVDSVIQFLTSKGYVLWNRKIGRNSWFINLNFIGYSKNQTIPITTVKPNNLTTPFVPLAKKY